MGKRLLFIAICALHLVGCGDRAKSSSRRTDLTTDGTPNRLSPQEPTPAQIREENKVAPLLIKPEKFIKLQPYQMPEPLRERLEQLQPDLIPKNSKDFQIFNQHLKISSRDSTMTFTGVLRVVGKADEPVELTCKFEKSKPTWVCPDMVPADENVAQGRRLQASVECSDPYVCDHTSLVFYVVIGTETHEQLFQAQKFSVRRGSSGDSEEVEEEGIPSIDLPKDEGHNEKPVIDPIPDKREERAPVVEEKPTKTGKFTNRFEQDGIVKPPPSRPPTTSPPKNQEDVGVTEVVPHIDIPNEEEEEEEEEDSLNDEELKALMDDPNSVLDMTPAVLPPAPTAGKYTIPNIEKLRPQISSGVPEQAIGSHNHGHLANAAKMPDRGPGFQCRNRVDRAYGANLMIDLLSGATGRVNQSFPNRSPFIIADIAKKTGGRLCGRTSCHKSHQTGLDADIVFPSSRPVAEMWKACPTTNRAVDRRGRVVRRTVCQPGGGVVDQFDESRFWQFSQQLTCAEKEPVVAMFIDTEIKRHMCRWVRQQGIDLTNPKSCAYKTLRAMKHEPSHYNHVHVRLKCPGNSRCRYIQITLGNGTGC